MLPAHQRSKTAQDYAFIMSQGNKVVKPSIIIYLYFSSDVEASAGFIVSKAVGNAVTRNLVKRRLRHLVRPYMQSGAHIVIRARPQAVQTKYEKLVQQFDAAWKKIYG